MRRYLVLYAVLPAAVGLTLLACYFSGVGVLMSLAASAGNREYGIVENLQNVILIAVVWLALRAARSEVGPARAFWRVVAAGAVLLLLEEIDFGLHYYESLFDIPGKERAQVRNLHNQYSSSHYLKQVVDLGMALFFVLLPLSGRLFSDARRRFVPNAWSIVTLLLSVAISKTAHWANDSGLPNNGALDSNISEFREIFVYYLWFLYFLQLAAGEAVATEPSPGAAKLGSEPA